MSDSTDRPPMFTFLEDDMWFEGQPEGPPSAHMPGGTPNAWLLISDALVEGAREGTMWIDYLPDGHLLFRCVEGEMEYRSSDPADLYKTNTGSVYARWWRLVRWTPAGADTDPAEVGS